MIQWIKNLFTDIENDVKSWNIRNIVSIGIAIVAYNIAEWFTGDINRFFIGLFFIGMLPSLSGFVKWSTTRDRFTTADTSRIILAIALIFFGLLFLKAN